MSEKQKLMKHKENGDYLGMCVCVKVTQSLPTLCKPMDCSPPGSSLHTDSPGKNTGVGCHTPPGDPTNPGIEPRPQALQMDSLSSELPGKPQQKRTV